MLSGENSNSLGFAEWLCICFCRADGDNKSVPFYGRSVRPATDSKQRDSPVQVGNKKDHSPGR